MSKSRGTQVDPDGLVATHGADALRLHLMYLGPWDQGGPWNDRGIAGMERLMRRAFQLIVDAPENRHARREAMTPALDVMRETHGAIQRVTEDLDGFQFNTAIAACDRVRQRADETEGRAGHRDAGMAPGAGDLDASDGAA